MDKFPPAAPGNARSSAWLAWQKQRVFLGARKPGWLLFTDADAELLLSAAARVAERGIKRRVDLLFAGQITQSPGTRKRSFRLFEAGEAFPTTP
jgi:hypothetical protein